jgi:hypothetical protein
MEDILVGDNFATGYNNCFSKVDDYFNLDADAMLCYRTYSDDEAFNFGSSMQIVQ